MLIKNTKNHFGLIAILFHWILALFIIGMLCVGFFMADLPIGLEKLKLYGLHKEFGILILALVLCRLFWRWINITPALKLPAIERIAARIAHWILYLLILVMPLTGWMMSSSAGITVSFFGLFTMPDLVQPDPELSNWFRTIHEYCAYALIAVILLHICGALKHHFIDRDDILKRIISPKSS